MTQFLLHLTLALLWMLLWGSFDLYTLLAGIVVGFLLLALFARVTGGAGVDGGSGRFLEPVRQVATLGYPTRLWRLICFAAYFVKILVVANWQVAKLVLAPSMPIHPRIIRYDVSGLTPAQLTTLASAITLTPGTLSADLSSGDRLLYIHCINAPDAEQAVREIDQLKDRLLKGVFT
ncbi:MAG TPA: Na+/H+ antiporter subunit E [Tepidisphaeraceae bacterium]|nr:Na+/H+ antiporter subunit E [Tepidisphaeraceae bacterium]